MSNLKVLTINLHCLEEKNILANQKQIVREILHRNIDIVFLQEVAQYDESDIVFENIKKSNYGYKLQCLLKEAEKDYFYYFVDIKHSFGKYNEGVGILSKYKLHNVIGNYISKSRDYYNWKSRKMIKGDLRLNGKTISIVSTHFGWTDENEKFEDQLERLLSHIDNDQLLLLGGDFNVSPRTTEYSTILNKELYDLYGSNPKHLFDPTHIKDIDTHTGSTRIDYIFSNTKLEVLDRAILFNKDLVSDHYGVYMKLKI